MKHGRHLRSSVTASACIGHCQRRLDAAGRKKEVVLISARKFPVEVESEGVVRGADPGQFAGCRPRSRGEANASAKKNREQLAAEPKGDIHRAVLPLGTPARARLNIAVAIAMPGSIERLLRVAG